MIIAGDMEVRKSMGKFREKAGGAVDFPCRPRDGRLYAPPAGGSLSSGRKDARRNEKADGTSFIPPFADGRHAPPAEGECNSWEDGSKEKRKKF
jgi:hypothetical protein